jgi:hypothetical protein
MTQNLLLLSATVLLLGGLPAYGQPMTTCETLHGPIPVGETFASGPEPGTIVGETARSRVNVRTGPGSEYDANAYGLVGDEIEVMGRAFSDRCDTWVQVQFPSSGQTGWIHSDFILIDYSRDWWD